MKNCIILGSGRSGTSMVAGSLANAGYFMGDNLISAREANPQGFFEDIEINNINEELLARILPKRPKFIGRWFFLSRPLYGQRWLSKIEVGKHISSNQKQIKRIKVLTSKEPFCFKDPRFSYTLPVWRPYLRNVVFVCVFRNPIMTVNSILREVKSDNHLKYFNISRDQALNIWLLMYRHILEIHRYEGRWLFLHYNQVLHGAGLERLANFTGTSVDFSFPNKSLINSNNEQSVPKEAKNIYQKLCEFACYEETINV